MKTLALQTNRQYTAAVRTLLANLVKLAVAGTLIGTLHAQDYVVAIILALYAILSIGKKFVSASQDRFIYLIGFLISAALGVACELWGIYFGHWEYHDLSGLREVPYWLPFAWGLAFTYIYKIEKNLVNSLQIHSTNGKILLALLAAMIFPTIGEMITIYLGVWTYRWPYQIFGVPLLAIFLLMVFHTGVNFLMTLICRRMRWYDPVFNP
ncbi:MAG: hypothetical protein JJU34_18705 [Lunatimonas sp.]|uniref:hypothetical protein n=1 Tax=Lunatimonas sp. TaxID=2060141 RepID=UPI00263B6BD6|nr:hypothetical protein [Lunatimonas sp.]MCC5939317.1 hypothetical protein [Lunatimonas sp.]